MGRGILPSALAPQAPVFIPQLRYAGRLATDPLNTLAQGEAHLYDGAGSQTGSGNRWGDYSSLTIDPVDDATFWYTNEYYSSTTSYNWRTRIGSFKLATGNPTPTPTPTATPTATATATAARYANAYCHTDSYSDFDPGSNGDAYTNADRTNRQWWTRRQHIPLDLVGCRRLLHQQRQLSSRWDGLHVFRREQQCVGTDLPDSHDSIDGYGKSDFLVQLQFE